MPELVVMPCQIQGYGLLKVLKYWASVCRKMSLGVLLPYVNGKLVSTFEIQYPILVLCTHLRIAAFTTLMLFHVSCACMH